MMELLPTMAYHIAADGDIKGITPENGTDFSLGEAQRVVEGYIEVLPLTDDQIMILNDEGKFCKDYNAVATVIAELHHAIFDGDYICGDVIICPAEMLK